MYPGSRHNRPSNAADDKDRIGMEIHYLEHSWDLERLLFGLQQGVDTSQRRSIAATKERGNGQGMIMNSRS